MAAGSWWAGSRWWHWRSVYPTVTRSRGNGCISHCPRGAAGINSLSLNGIARNNQRLRGERQSTLTLVDTFLISRDLGRRGLITGLNSKAKYKLKLSQLPQGRLKTPEELEAEKIAKDEEAAAAATAAGKKAGSRRRKKAAEIDDSEEASPQPEETHYPTVIQQAYENMKQFPECVVITRVGGFYELYLEHAEEYGPLLNLKVAKKKTLHGPVSMAGFPFFQIERYLKILVQDHHKHVAVAEEFAKSDIDSVRTGGILHDRRVARIITPGTLIDETFMDPYSNNYVLSVSVASKDTVLNVAHHGNAALEDTASELAAAGTKLGLAWLDLSTGHFFTQETDLAGLPGVLSRISPREVVLDVALMAPSVNPEEASTVILEDRHPAAPDISATIRSVLAEDRLIVSYSDEGNLDGLASWEPMLESSIPAVEARLFTSQEISAGNLLLHYVEERLQGSSMTLQAPKRRETLNVMSIDKTSLRSLEIKQTMKDCAFKGSLLHAIRKTVTKSGARLLSEWVVAPSTDLQVIQNRQDIVSLFLANADLRDTIIVLLKRSHDSQRLVQKFALGRGDADDLLALAATIDSTKHIANILYENLGKIEAANTSTGMTSGAGSINTLLSRLSLDGPQKLAKQIRDAIDEDGLQQQHEIEETAADEMMTLAREVVNAEGTIADMSALPRVISAATTTTKKKVNNSIRDVYGEDNEVWVMKPSASRILKRIHADLDALHAEKVALAEELRTRYEAPSLALKWVAGLGHICHIKGKDASFTSAIVQSPDLQARTLKSSKTTRSFHLPVWTELGIRIDQTRQSIRSAESRIFATLRTKVIANLVRLRRNAAVLDELDITTSFALLAQETNLVRPILCTESITRITGGRHPTVEGGLRAQGRSFTRNDCFLGGKGSGLLWLITGPNMAGKSTFLRQNALLTILAQVGCFIPAESAQLGIVDAIFSRVGSADNLFRDQSTFMVEMLETARILRSATERSFVIMDEIGRGTTPEDGTAVAYASLKYLVQVNKCRALFATHFHAVADMAREDGLITEETGLVEAYCTDVEEDGLGGFIYVHRLMPGVNRQSHALKVAGLAGLPELAIETAKKVLERNDVDT